MGPIHLPPGLNQPAPAVKRKRRWGLLVVWTLLVFVGGAVTGVSLLDQVSPLAASSLSALGIRVPRFLHKGTAEAPSVLPAPAQDIAEPAPAPEVVPIAAAPKEPIGEKHVEAAATQHVATQADRPDKDVEPSKASAVAASRKLASPHGQAGAASAKSENAALEPAAAQATQPKGEAKTGVVAGASAKKGSKYHDPFESADDNAGEPKAAQPSHKSEAKREEPVAKAAPKSHDSLDNLMADVVTDNKGKGKKHDSKDIDSMLKDVQKSNPEPAPKREAPAALPPLSPSDISKVMAGVKTHGNECAQRLGQKGVAELKLVVGKDGKVTSANVGGKLANTPVAACIEKAARAATFPPSSGLRFDYRIDVR